MPSLPGGTVVLDNGETAGNNTVSGDINISGGILTGKIDIRKGNPLSTFSTKDEKGEVKIYNVISSGNINISGGQFRFTEDDSQIIMYENNMGNISISGGQWNVGGNVLVQGLEKQGYTVDVIGGQFNIDEGKTLTLTGFPDLWQMKRQPFRFREKER